MQKDVIKSSWWIAHVMPDYGKARHFFLPYISRIMLLLLLSKPIVVFMIKLHFLYVLVYV